MSGKNIIEISLYCAYCSRERNIFLIGMNLNGIFLIDDIKKRICIKKFDNFVNDISFEGHEKNVVLKRRIKKHVCVKK